ncbi:hypothetical protein [Anaerorhabdus sp.]|uniref:hypothetical protein n=1 Tax=Anaerorhabdus sp. TaxID=1872524 RepID=UPI002FCC3641
MKDMIDVLKEIYGEDFSKYEEVMEYCDKRVTADEGIPAIIGLDDLTADRDVVYEGAKMESDFNITMAFGAMVFESLYAKQSKEKLGNYPAIAPAMSAVAEMYFHQKENGEIVQYRDVIKKHLDKKVNHE